MHAYKTRNLDLLPRPHVRDRAAFLEKTLVHAHVRELSVPALLELKRQADEGSVGGWSEGLRRVRGGNDREGEGGDFFGSREVEADAVEYGLNRLIGESGAEEDGGELEGDGGATDCVLSEGGISKKQDEEIREELTAISTPDISRSSSQASAISSSTSARVSMSSARLAIAASTNSLGMSPDLTIILN